MNEAIITFLVYSIGMLVIGIWTYKKTQTLSDYILGGRSLNSWVSALSAQASDFSGWLLLGLPGACYAAGLNGMWIAVGLAIGAYCNWQFIAKRLRRYTEVAGNSLTLSAFFENRFRDKSRLLRIISSIFILIFYLIYTASGLVATGKLFESIFGISFETGVWIGALVVISYTFLGGFLAVSYTDVIQGLMMLGALILAPAVVISQLGGIDGLWNQLAQINPDLLDAGKTVTYDYAKGIFWETNSESFSYIAIISLLAWGLGYFGQPHILARFMAIRTAKEIPKARLIAMVWIAFSLWGAMFVGFAGIAYFDKPLQDPEKVFLLLNQALFNPWVAGLLLAAVLAAIMSTVDSQLVVASSALAEDLYKGFRKNVSQKELVWIGRAAVILISVISLYLALSGSQIVFEIVAYAWAGFGAVFGPPIILSLFWKRTTGTGVLWGMIVGGATVIIWKNYIGLGIYEIIPGFILSLLTIVIVSLVGKPPHSDIQQEFMRASRPLEYE